MNLFELAMAARPVELALLLAIFIGILWHVLSPRRRGDHRQNAMIPLRDDCE